MNALWNLLNALWNAMNSPLGIAIVGMIAAAIVAWICKKKPAVAAFIDAYGGTLIAAVKWAEKIIPDDSPQTSIRRLDAALKYVLTILQERGVITSPAMQSTIREALQKVHSQLEASGQLAEPLQLVSTIEHREAEIQPPKASGFARVGTLLALCVLGAFVAIPSSGCGWALSEIDTLHALQDVNAVNAANWEKVRSAQLAFLDQQAQVLEQNAAQQIGQAADGGEAAVVFTAYLTTKGALQSQRQAVEREYGEALDNAYLAEELRSRQQAVRSGWWALFRQIPGADALKAVAEQKAREAIGQEGSSR